jgi:glycosyltransferase involved in cell wall biosynthesis
MHSDVKCHELLISATSAIVGEFPSARFILVGDGTQRQQFEQAVSALSLAQRFLFVGQRNDIPEFLACCDVAVLPSKADRLPNAVLEYMAAGLPVVSSNVGGNSESIRDGVTGLLVPSQDAPGSSARRCSDCCAIPAWRAGSENQARHMSVRTSALND